VQKYSDLRGEEHFLKGNFEMVEMSRNLPDRNHIRR